ncbi:hypothetical protein [Kingella oralis]|uniref:hypothetical protein n=1 Tax=Kingella oralis TaxID=505 RepID=UPI0034E5A2A9
MHLPFSAAKSASKVECQQTLELNREYHVARYLPQALAMGDDGGSGLFLHMACAAGKGLYYCRTADWDAAEAVKIADSLRGLLVEGQGRARLAAL